MRKSEYDIPILILAKASRACERRKNNRPKIADIKHVKCTEDVDVILMLYREDYYNEEASFTGDSQVAELIVAKHPDIDKQNVTVKLMQCFNPNMIKDH